MRQLFLICTFTVLSIFHIAAQTALQVVTLIPPVEYFASQIGREHSETRAILPPLVSPELFSMEFSSLQELAAADMYLSLGFPADDDIIAYLQAWHPEIAIIHLTEGLSLLSSEEEMAHAMEEEEMAHMHGDFDPHVWLGLPEVRIMAEHIFQSFIAYDPAHTNDYTQNYVAFAQELDVLDMQLRELLEPLRGRRFFTNHPAFGYYARTYGLIPVSLEQEGREIGPRALIALIQEAQSLQIKGVLGQPQFSGKNIEAFAKAVGAQVLMVDILQGDWSRSMQDIAQAIQFSIHP